jgi:prepilin-type N-terminal cleavage/methylation domain-containing protein
MNRTSPSPEARAAFTLVEMLVSIAVLALIMTFIGQMMSSVSLSTTLSSKHIDTDNQARLVFDRMALDIGAMPHRTDIEYLFVKGPKSAAPGSQQDPSDKMFFYSQAPAFFSSSNSNLFPAVGTIDPKSPMALVGYCINTGFNNSGSNVTPPPYCLQRLSKGLTWDQSVPNGPGGIMFMTFNPAGNPSKFMTPLPGSTLVGNPLTQAALTAVDPEPVYTGSDPDYDVLANQVFRMEFCFQVKDLSPSGGTVYSNYPIATFIDTQNPNSTNSYPMISQDDPAVSGSTGKLGDRWYNYKENRAFEITGFSGPGTTGTTYWTPIGLSDATAIVVAIAVMDTNSRKVLSQAQLASAAAYLPKFLPDQLEGNNTQLLLSGTTDSIATTWQKALNGQTANGNSNPFYQAASIPQAAAGQIRVYQHVFYLNNN